MQKSSAPKFSCPNVCFGNFVDRSKPSTTKSTSESNSLYPKGLTEPLNAAVCIEGGGKLHEEEAFEAESKKENNSDRTDRTYVNVDTMQALWMAPEVLIDKKYQQASDG